MKLKRWIGLVAVLNLAMIAILLGRPQFSNASRPVRGIANPVVAMELVRNVAEVDAILGDAPSADREVMRIKQYADFGFIGGYAALFVLMSMLLEGEGRAVAILAAVLGVSAAACDVVEDLGILRILDVDLSHTTQALVDSIRYPSLMKWGLASLTLGLLGVLAWRSGLRIIGILSLSSALLGLYGLFENRILQFSQLPVIGVLIGLAFLYFRPHYWRNRRGT
jgi:hypothetical protein